MIFGVITDIPDPTTGGNLASAMDLYRQIEDGNESNGWLGRFERLDIMVALELRYPVFTLGEILVLDDSGREVSGIGRKPSKWFVSYETFDTIELAVDRAREITAMAMTTDLNQKEVGRDG